MNYLKLTNKEEKNNSSIYKNEESKNQNWICL